MNRRNSSVLNQQANKIISLISLSVYLTTDVTWDTLKKNNTLVCTAKNFFRSGIAFSHCLSCISSAIEDAVKTPIDIIGYKDAAALIFLLNPY